jgi:hypothetical protein
MTSSFSCVSWIGSPLPRRTPRGRRPQSSNRRVFWAAFRHSFPLEFRLFFRPNQKDQTRRQKFPSASLLGHREFILTLAVSAHHSAFSHVLKDALFDRWRGQAV